MDKFILQKHNAGVTLIELLISIFILTLIWLAVSAFQKDVFSLNSAISNSLNAQQDARRAFKTMAAEIRGASPSSTGAYAVSQANSTVFIFYSNIDSDQLIERIRYFLDGNTIKRGVLKPSGNPLAYNSANESTSEVVHYVANGATPIFQYYDSNYDGTTPPLGEPVNTQAIRLIQVTAVIDLDAARPPSPVTLTTQVSMRNLKDNL